MELPKQYVLVVIQGDNVGKRYPLKNAINTLGRSPENMIVIDTLQISRRHIRLSPAVGSFAIEDIGSTNGTWVNGERLTRPYILVSGDELQFAGGFALRFEQQTAQLSQEMLPPTTRPSATAAKIPVTLYSDTDTDAPPPMKSTPAWLKSTDEEESTQRNRGRLVLIIILVVLSVIALVVAISIWGSSPEFWGQVLGWFNIPVP